MDRLAQQQERIINIIEKIALKMEVTESNNDGFPSTRQEWASSSEQLLSDERMKRLKLYRAALNGGWEVAERMYDNHIEDMRVDISRRGDTALHIATAAKHIDFVKELMKNMNENDLKKKNNLGQTALFLAAASGMVELAKELMKNNKEIAMIRDMFGTLPIDKAASLGHKDMVEYLYRATKRDLTEEDRKQLFVSAIETDLYDVAQKLLTDHPNLATARAPAGDDEIGVSALHVLAGKHLTFSKLANQYQRESFEIENRRLQGLQLVERIWKKIVLLDDLQISQLISEPRKLIFYAAKGGNVEFLSILISEYPDLVWKVDNPENQYSIFHIAVINRQEDVFKLIYELGVIKDLIFMPKDMEGNNILHLAGMLAPSDRLTIVPGPALQMQRELSWFKAVQNVVQPKFAEVRNKKGWTPKELFTKKHEALREKGEKWMKETAGSCMVVATLVTGVAFAAAITVPGGNDVRTGFPVFYKRFTFKIFAISDVLTLLSSTTAIFSFLSIFTSRFAEEDFDWWLLRKLNLGLLTLFISIVAMMVMFSITFFIHINHRRLWITIPVGAVTSIPIIFLTSKHFQLYYDVLHSIHASDTLFQQSTVSLFGEEESASDQPACSTNV